MTNSKPREWWIIRHPGQEYRLACDSYEEAMKWYEGFNSITAHVIEYSAYQSLKSEAIEFKIEIDALKKVLHDVSANLELENERLIEELQQVKSKDIDDRNFP